MFYNYVVPYFFFLTRASALIIGGCSKVNIFTHTHTHTVDLPLHMYVVVVVVFIILISAINSLCCWFLLVKRNC